MEKTLKNLNIKSFIQENLSSVVIYSLLPVLLLFCGLAVNGYFDSIRNLNTLTAEVEGFKTKATTITDDKSLVGTSLDDYNTLLSRLIPENEDFFSIILALERLSQESGFIILRYNIILGATTREKLALTIEGDGNADAFLKFLENYPFGGGRLITNEKIEFSTDALGKIKLSLNFYHKKIPSNIKSIAKLSKDDITVLNQAKEKTSFIFQSATPQIVEEVQYDTKTNPF